MVTKIKVLNAWQNRPSEIEVKKRGRKTAFKLAYDGFGNLTNVEIRGTATLKDIRPLLPIPTPIIEAPESIERGEPEVRYNTVTNGNVSIVTIPDVINVFYLTHICLSAVATGAGTAYLTYRDPVGAAYSMIFLEFPAAGGVQSVAIPFNNLRFKGGAGTAFRVTASNANVIAHGCISGIEVQR